jgi:hypothetical protein
MGDCTSAYDLPEVVAFEIPPIGRNRLLSGLCINYSLLMGGYWL